IALVGIPHVPLGGVIGSLFLPRQPSPARRRRPHGTRRTLSMVRCNRAMLGALAAVFAAAPGGWAAPEGDEFFEKEIRPLLVEHCHKCHGDAKPKGGLRLT